MIGLVSNAMDSTCLRLRPIYLFIYWLRILFFHLSMVYGRRPLQTWSEWIIVGIRNRGMNKGCTRLPVFFVSLHGGMFVTRFMHWGTSSDTNQTKEKKKKYVQRILMAQGIEQNRTPSSGQSRPKSPTLFATSSVLDPRI